MMPSERAKNDRPLALEKGKEDVAQVYPRVMMCFLSNFSHSFNL